MDKYKDPEKKLQGYLHNRTLLMKLKAYAIEIDSTYEKLIENEFEAFEQALIKKGHEIDEIRLKAFQDAREEQERQAELVQYPLQVVGHEVEDKIGVVEPITS